MAKEITDIDLLQKYLEGVMERSEHHANEVNEIVLALIGAVIWKKNSKHIKVREHAGELANVLWWYSKDDRRYAFKYNHEQKKIELRKDTFRGDLVMAFDNNTKIDEIINLFGTL